MARAAVPGRLTARLTWRVAHLIEARPESASARTLVLRVPGWPGHLAGQHVDLRLTAEDGYSTQRSYSIANAATPADGDSGLVELTVQRVVDGEVSGYLTDAFAVGSPVELRGPVGGWFVWRPHDQTGDAATAVQLIAGGSGVVPLMAMVRARAAAGSRVPFKLLYCLRTPQDLLYGEELRQRARDDAGLDVALWYTRAVPDGWHTAPGRLTAASLRELTWPAQVAPACYLCGPTGFVETVADILVTQGHDAARIKTERFG
jgi:ferredoxin-NADP reductase